MSLGTGDNWDVLMKAASPSLPQHPTTTTDGDSSWGGGGPWYRSSSPVYRKVSAASLGHAADNQIRERKAMFGV